MDLTFQVPMQYCSLQHQTLLSPLNKSTTGCHFCFDLASSLFLELLVIALCSFPVAYWTPSDLGGGAGGAGFIFWSHIFLPFYTVHGILTPRILEWFAISSSSGPHFVRTLHCDLTILGSPAWLGSWLH